MTLLQALESMPEVEGAAELLEYVRAARETLRAQRDDSGPVDRLMVDEWSAEAREAAALFALREVVCKL